MEEVIIVKTGKANVASVISGLIRAGAKSRLSEDPDEINSASYVVIPGVGAYGPAMKQLQSLKLDDAIRHRILAGKPTLAICLGMQLLAKQSEESPEVDGIGVIPGVCKRFNEDIGYVSRQRIPQLGWNNVNVSGECKLLESGYAYFANSYYLDKAPEGWQVAHTTYGETFISAIEKSAVLACQFHPELSGVWGRDLIIRWLRKGKRLC
jgi:imidazole glycerol phosphate synthase glutamine amidotransferase subunit